MERKLACATMLRDDYDFLRKWISHYEKFVEERTDLYIIAHGKNAVIEEIASGCSIITIPHFENGSQFEPRRRKLLFGLVAALRAYFHHILVVDVDEFVVLDPNIETSFPDYLTSVEMEGRVLSPVGFDIVHKCSLETAPFDFKRPFLSQRSHGYLEAAYMKPCIFRDAPTGGGNAHFIDGEPWQIDPNLMLFHMKYFDRDYGLQMAQKRFETVTGYEKHSNTHRIGGWHNRAQKLETTVKSIESETAISLTRTAAVDFASDMRAAFEERGRFPWNISQRGPYRVPERFRDRV